MFTKGFGKFACEGDTITCEVDGFTATATVYRDDTPDMPDQRDDGFWPSRDPNAAGYVASENFEAEQARAERVMAAWKNDEWFFCGVAVTIEKKSVRLTGRYDHALWGVECNYPDSDNDYLREVANDLLPDAIEAARAKLRTLCADKAKTCASLSADDFERVIAALSIYQDIEDDNGRDSEAHAARDLIERLQSQEGNDPNG